LGKEERSISHEKEEKKASIILTHGEKKDARREELGSGKGGCTPMKWHLARKGMNFQEKTNRKQEP